MQASAIISTIQDDLSCLVRGLKGELNGQQVEHVRQNIHSIATRLLAGLGMTISAAYIAYHSIYFVYQLPAAVSIFIFSHDCCVMSQNAKNAGLVAYERFLGGFRSLLSFTEEETNQLTQGTLFQSFWKSLYLAGNPSSPTCK